MQVDEEAGAGVETNHPDGVDEVVGVAEVIQIVNSQMVEVVQVVPTQEM